MNKDFTDFERFGEETPMRSPRYFSALTTLICGFIGSVLLLLGCFAIWYFTEFAPLSFVMWHIVPVGAFLVGLAASFAYYLPARMLQYRPTRQVIITILMVQVCAFFVGRYLEYVPICYLFEEPPTFVEYYRYSIEEAEWSSLDDQGKEPYKLGLWGWGIELLALAAFAFAGLIGPGILAGGDYCDDCQRFMKTTRLMIYPIRAPYPKLKKNDLAGEQAYHEEDTAIIGEAVAYLKNLVAFLETEPRPTANAIASRLDDNVLSRGYTEKQKQKIPNNIFIWLSECPLCDKFELLVTTAAKNPENRKETKAKIITAFELIRYNNGGFTTNTVETLEQIGNQLHG